jgi:molybdate transport system ATP-binding protein
VKRRRPGTQAGVAGSQGKPAEPAATTAAGQAAAAAAATTTSLEVRLRASLREFELDVDFTAEPSGRLALLGPSGAGKSTILRMVAGLVRPGQGLIRVGLHTLFDDRDGTDLPPEARRVGYVPQDPTLFPHLDAAANVAYAIRTGRGSARRRRATELLDAFGLGSMAKVRPYEMSGGEAQRVSLARAIAADPDLFLLDEPLASLDTVTHQKALPVLAGMLDQAGVPVLLVTHSTLEAGRLAGRSIRIEKGRIASGTDQSQEETKWNPNSGSGTSQSRPVSIRRTMKR